MPRDGELCPTTEEAEESGDGKRRCGEGKDDQKEKLIRAGAINARGFFQFARDGVEVAFEIPNCKGKLHLQKGSEVGNIFDLGTKYSDAFEVSFSVEDGSRKTALG